ncbi:MAG: hypothetical protein AAF439_09465 [Pseudomonadota bacterium]
MSVAYDDMMPGDVILNVREGTAIHSAIYVGKLLYESDSMHTIAHCDPPVLSFGHPSELTEGSADAVIYRCSDTDLSTKAVVYAKEWARWALDARESVPPGTTMYPSGAGARHHGVIRDRPIPFQFDALYRAVKWAARLSTLHEDMPEQAQLSKNRGTTCCAYVIACYQAAAFNNYAKGVGAKLRIAETCLKAARGPKHPDRLAIVESPTGSLDDETGEVKRGPYNRANIGMTNAGFRGQGETKRTFEQYMVATLEALRPLRTCRIDLSPADLMTDAMALDAKFTYSDVLHTALETSKDWAKLGKMEVVEFD